MTERPAVSVLIAWCNRDELRLTLAANRSVFLAQNAEVLVVNCAGSSARLRGLIAESEVEGVRQLDLPLERFNKSMALNLGLAHARSKRIFVLDADVAMLSPIPLEALSGDSLVTVQWVYESVPGTIRTQRGGAGPDAPSGNANSLQLAFRNGTKVRHQLSHHDAARNRRSGLGMLLAHKSDLLKVEGYHSGLEGWGWEDDDILLRLQYLLGRRRIEAGAALHLSHGNDRRVLSGTRSQSDRRNFLMCCRNYNLGRFLGTYRADVTKLEGQIGEIAAGAPAAERIPPPAPLPEDCGTESVTSPESGDGPPALGDLLVESVLAGMALENSRVLLVGIAASWLAEKLAPRCRQITLAAPEAVPDGLRRGGYEFIIDSRLVSRCCCRRHVRAALEADLPLLAPGGWLPMTDHAAESASGRPGFSVSKAGCGVYALAQSRRRAMGG